MCCFLVICLDRELFSERVSDSGQQVLLYSIYFVRLNYTFRQFDNGHSIALVLLAGLKSGCYVEIEFIISVTYVTEQLGSLEVKIDVSFKRKDRIYGIFHD